MTTATHNTPVMKDVIDCTSSAGGGETLGLRAACRSNVWFMIVVIIPVIQNGSESVYRADSAYHPATAYCSGRVHDVGVRTIRGATYGGPA